MTKTTHFELVSPERKLMSEDVFMAVIPGDEGMFGVQSGHASLVASLKCGVVKVYKAEGGDVLRIFIAGGFADVTPAGCTVLAEEAVNVNDLKKDVLERDLADLAEDLGMASEKLDKARIQDKIVVVKAKLQAVRA